MPNVLLKGSAECVRSKFERNITFINLKSCLDVIAYVASNVRKNDLAVCQSDFKSPHNSKLNLDQIILLVNTLLNIRWLFYMCVQFSLVGIKKHIQRNLTDTGIEWLQNMVSRIKAFVREWNAKLSHYVPLSDCHRWNLTAIGDNFWIKLRWWSLKTWNIWSTSSGRSTENHDENNNLSWKVLDADWLTGPWMRNVSRDCALRLRTRYENGSLWWFEKMGSHWLFYPLCLKSGFCHWNNHEHS